MRPRLLPLFLAALLLTGCFGRQAHYDGDPAPAPDRPAVAFNGPTADMPVERVVSFITIANPYISPALVRLEAEAIVRCSAKEGVPTSLLVSLIATESSFNPRAVSPVGAQGLGQLMPPTARDMGVTDPFDPEQNIAGTAKYIAWLSGYWAKHPRRWELTLASYLAGVGTVGNQLKAGRDLTAEQATYVRKILKLCDKV